MPQPCSRTRILAAITLPMLQAAAHEPWIYIVPDDRGARIEIGSGHAFPRSEVLIAERLVAEAVVVNPEGQSLPLRLEARDKVWGASVSPLTPGVWCAFVALKRAQDQESVFYGRALLVVGGQDDPTRYSTGRGLEIVPKTAVSGLQPKGSLPVEIHLDGASVAGTIRLTLERGCGGFFTTERDRPAIIPLKTAGAYLLTTSHKGKTFALMFAISDRPGGLP